MMPATLQPRRKTFKVNLISSSFHSRTQRLEENTVKVFLFFSFCNKGRICKRKSFFLISVYYYYYIFCLKKNRHSEYGVNLQSHFFVVLNLNNPMWLLLNASLGFQLFLISVAPFFFLTVITRVDLFSIFTLHQTLPPHPTLPPFHHIHPWFYRSW